MSIASASVSTPQNPRNSLGEASDDQSTIEKEYPSFIPRYRRSTDSYGKWMKQQMILKPSGIFAESRYQEETELLAWFQDPEKVTLWRVKDRMKTVSVALVICLNIGVDPPDILKIPPHAKLQCWIDPTEQTPSKSLENIGKNLQAQYEVWQAKARFKQCLDPTAEDVKKLCISLRKSSKDERVLFHYNGHGVPKPTQNGEIWVFNKEYTQYIPLSIYELQNWMASPSMYVFDCSNAGLILQTYMQFADQRDKDNDRKMSVGSSYTSASDAPIDVRDVIILGACGANENLPLNPDIPADLFTSCLTTPIQIAIKWFAKRSHLIRISGDLAEKIPGRLIDRRTPLGELNWIFTAVTDTIAWNVLSQELFQKLFRQDMLVASLLRNYLLSERIMRSYNCNPVCYPKIPSTFNHTLWDAWEMSLEGYLAQMPAFEKDPNYVFQSSTFFADQLTAFEMWLELATESTGKPEQLPIVLQVLLSQSHRLRALNLLARFLDLGPWAVNMGLSVGIFPYVLKLLQSPAVELRETLVFIWAKLLSVDQTCQIDLVKENSHTYFINVLSSADAPIEQRTTSAYVISLILYKNPFGQNQCLQSNLLHICIGLLTDVEDSIRLWSCLCLGNLWVDYEEAKMLAIKENAHEKVLQLLSDPCHEVRAAAIHALGLFIGKFDPNNENRMNIEHSIGLSIIISASDLSSLVRQEQVAALHKIVNAYRNNFRDAAIISAINELKKRASETNEPLELSSEVEAAIDECSKQTGGTTYEIIWDVILQLSYDPIPQVANHAIQIIQQMRSSFHIKLPLDRIPLPVVQRNKATRKSATLSSRSNVRSGSPQRATMTTASPAALKRIQSSTGMAGVRSSDFESAEEKMKRTMSSGGFMGLDSYDQLNMIADYSADDFDSGNYSNYYEWSCKRFNISKQALDTDPHSASSCERRWKLTRNEKFDEDIGFLRTKSISSKFDKQIALLDNNSELIYSMTFHPYENQLIVADEKNEISVWDVESGYKLNSFSNRTSSKNRITSFKMFSDCDYSLLAVGSDDGIVRVWKNFENNGEQNLISGWKALPTPANKGNGCGLVMDWCTESDIIAASGDLNMIKLWNVQRELSVSEIQTETDAFVTCMSVSRSILSAGFSDGVVRLYDVRMPQSSSLIKSFAEHKGWVVSTFIQKFSQNEIISGSVNGDIRFWDTRQSSSVKSITAHTSSMVSFTAHENLSLLASGSKNQHIKIFNTKAETINILQYHNSFLGQRIGMVSSLAFHPRRLLLAAGSADSIISIYSGANISGDR